MRRYIDLTLSLGALHAVAVTPEDIVFDGRTILKCMFGCDDWGRGHTCPSRPGSLMPWEYEPLLRKYRHVIVVHARDKRTAQRASFAVERAAFLDGDHMAFSLSDCALCAECAGKEGKPCVSRKKRVRPSIRRA